MQGPIIIGGTGGSGTRLVAEILHRAGVDMGSIRNPEWDALPFVYWYHRWVEPYFRQHGGKGRLSCPAMEIDFAEAVNRHKRGLQDPSARWGWKMTTNLFFLPFLNEQFPDCQFIHVVRDPRDVCYSQSQHEVNDHGAALLSGMSVELPTQVAEFAKAGPGREVLRRMMLWLAVNTRAADYGEEYMVGRYLPVSYDRLCERPADTIWGMLAFGELDADEVELAKMVQDPGTRGRWATKPHEQREVLGHAATEALQRFGFGPPPVQTERVEMAKVDLAPAEELTRRAKRFAARDGRRG